MSNSESEAERDHLEGIECGAGCTEIWEHLSDQRTETSGTDAADE